MKQFICTIRTYDEEFHREGLTAGKVRYRLLLQLWEAFDKRSFTFKDIKVRVAK